ncbi:response regulator [Sanguibacter inulinus]|uniref:Response regulator transcription factor n=1 Tax=Sanguibacter inulinus TaxID=60922 RepID=A0A853EZ79_9MICO|nr:response regulator transcription factor [Sanguibacter inulinus]MBF0723438.1 response regulator transcription factor [Sanguibacter inulinus]NYS94583.1 response regulator transcription factor [Sanguibacter inulinus]
MIRVLLVDDDPLVRRSLRQILDSDPGIEVVAEADDGDAVVEAVQAHHPDLVLMDLRMRRVHGVEATAAVRALPGAPEVVAMTSFGADEQVLRALDAGARGFLLKDTSPSAIKVAVHDVMAGDASLSPAVARYLVDHVTSDRHGPVRDGAAGRLAVLTDRERQIALGVHAGLTNDEIGRQLFVSGATVKTHLSNVLTKLDLDGRVQLAILVERSGTAAGTTG